MVSSVLKSGWRFAGTKKGVESSTPLNEKFSLGLALAAGQTDHPDEGEERARRLGNGLGKGHFTHPDPVASRRSDAEKVVGGDQLHVAGVHLREGKALSRCYRLGDSADRKRCSRKGGGIGESQVGGDESVSVGVGVSPDADFIQGDTRAEIENEAWAGSGGGSEIVANSTIGSIGDPSLVAGPVVRLGSVKSDARSFDQPVSREKISGRGVRSNSDNRIKGCSERDAATQGKDEERSRFKHFVD